MASSSPSTATSTSLRWLVLATLVLQLWAVSRIEGYQIADSVEFMERARAFVRGEEVVDASVIRPFGFSFLLVPFFAVADWLGLADQRMAMPAIVGLQMLLGVLLVVVTTRVGTRLGTPTIGVVAGALVAANPVFLQYSTQPVSGLAAGVCVGLALDRLLRAQARDPLWAGLWLSAAFVMAYQTLLVVFAVVFVLLLLRGWRRRSELLWVLAGLTVGLLAQSLMDWIMYGSFGGSLINYLAANVGSTIVSNLYRLYLLVGWEPLKALAAYVYDIEQGLLGRGEWVPSGTPEARALMSPWFYVHELPHMLVWPAIGALALALPRLLWSRSRAAWLLALVFAINVYVMSHKGSKDFRLWLPLLPLMAPLAAWGVEWLWQVLPSPRGVRLLRAGFLTAVLVLSLHELQALNTRKYSGYLRAMEWLDAFAASRPEDVLSPHDPGQGQAAGTAGAGAGTLAVASAYNWAVFLRHSPRVHLVKLPAQMNMWKQYPRRENGRVREHEEILATLEECDALILHMGVLAQDARLGAHIARDFDAAAAFWDQSVYEELGAVLVFVRRDLWRGGRLVERTEPARAAERLAQLSLRGTAMDFVSRDGTERVRFHGFEVQQLAAQDLWWITYHWTPLTPLSRDWTIVDRLSDPEEREGWQNDHHLTAGRVPRAEFVPGELLSEGSLLAPAHAPFERGVQPRYLGGPWRGGDLLPLSLWLGVRELAPGSEGSAAVVLDTLSPAPVAGSAWTPPAEGERAGSSGTRWTLDGLIHAGSILLPTRPDARLSADDQWRMQR